MIISSYVKDEFLNVIPAVIHIDKTSRPQSVNKKTNKIFYELLLEFKKLAGHPILLNTSFNIKDKPIVMSPRDAIKCFYDTGIDVLVLGNFIIKKKYI